MAVYGTYSLLDFNHKIHRDDERSRIMKKLLLVLAAIVYFPFGVIFALAKNYK